MTEHGPVAAISAPEPRTLHELAQRSVDNARARLECAAIELAGAMERQRMVMAREDRPLAPSEDPQWTPAEIAAMEARA